MDRPLTSHRPAPRASVIIPTWNGRDLLSHALRSLELQTFTDFETIVVDNGSTDGTAGEVAARFPHVRVIRLAENLGFAPAVNVGMRAAAGEVLVLMNNDTEAEPDWLAELVAALDAHPDAGSCASKMLDGRDRRVIDSAGVQLGLFASNIGEGQLDGADFAEVRRIFGACGGAAAYRRVALDCTGLLDETFFAYAEDVDLSARLQLAGFSCVYVPTAVISHRGSATSDRMPELRFYLLMRNSITVFLRYAGLRRLCWTPLVLVWPFVRAVIDRQHPRVAARAILHSLRALPDILRVRRAVARTRRISHADFRALLAPPLTRAGRKPASPQSPSHVAVDAAPFSGEAIRETVRQDRAGRVVQFMSADPSDPVTSTPPGDNRVESADAEPGDVDVIIVNWNGRRWLSRCIDALESSRLQCRVTVVDNASSDGSASHIRQRFPQVEVIDAGDNVGYAAGANIGIRRSQARYVFVMNPDVIVTPEHIEALRDRLDANSSIGAAQGMLYNLTPAEFDAGETPARLLDSAGHLIRRSRMVVDRGQGEPDGPEYRQEASIFSACGAALFLRRAMLEDVASDGEYFAESFFAYKEDIDLCWRARLLGWDIRYIPDAVAHHVRAVPYDSDAWRRMPRTARRHSWKNHYLLIVRNDRMPDLLRDLPFIMLWELARLGHVLLRDPRSLAAYADLIREVPAAVRARRDILSRRRSRRAELHSWFGAMPVPVRRDKAVMRHEVVA